MKKFMTYLIPVVTLSIFILIMLSGRFLKEPFKPSEDVVGFVNKSINDTKEEKWQEVNKDVQNLEYAWNKILPRIQFSVERDEIYNINANIARMKGCIVVKDKENSIVELYELLENWDELTK